MVVVYVYELTVLAMGWSSVFITQSIHEHLLDTATGLYTIDRINHINDLRVDRTRHMVYVDDLIIIGFDLFGFCGIIVI